MIGAMLLGMLAGCGGEAGEVAAPVVAAPAAAADTDIDVSDLLGQPESPFPPGAIGIRGEGPQNGGPTYGPRLGEIPPGGLGKGTYGAPATANPEGATPASANPASQPPTPSQ